MSHLLVATSAGCLAFSGTGASGNVELPGRQISAIAAEEEGACLAAVDGNEIWRRGAAGDWSKIAATSVSIQAMTLVDGNIYAAVPDAALVRINASGEAERLTGFDTIAGRSKWFAQGPPLHVRALTTTADGGAIMAAVHVGGIPRSTDSGKTWLPTVPVDFDIHEVRTHPSLPNFAAAAAGVGLCLSHDGGQNWTLIKDGLQPPHSLSVAILEDEVLFSIQDGPFAEQSQIWRLKIADNSIEQVRDGLPEWLSGKVDTAHITTGHGQAAIVDGAGNVWRSQAGSTNWELIGKQPHYVYGMLIV